MIDPVASALNALATYLPTVVTMPSGGYPTVSYRRGWPERSQDLDLSASSVVVLTAGEDVGVEHSPVPLDHNTSTGVTLYKVGDLKAPVLLTLWCPTRATLDDLLPRLRHALVGASVPYDMGLTLTQADYYGVKVRFDVQGVLRSASPSGPEAGAWEAQIRLTLTGEWIVSGSLDTLDSVVVEHG